jgi:hypothetical protein
MARMARLRFMKLLELLNAANQGYPDGDLAEYYDTQDGKRKSGRVMVWPVHRAGADRHLRF